MDTTAILFLSQNYHKPELLRVFTDLDRLASGLMIQRYNIYERVKRYSKLLKAIESATDLYTLDSPLELQQLEKENILRIFNSELYLMKKIRHQPDTVYLLIGIFGVTIVFNVPLNDALATIKPSSTDAANLWTSYLANWMLWNHIRTAAGIAHPKRSVILRNRLFIVL